MASPPNDLDALLATAHRAADAAVGIITTARANGIGSQKTKSSGSDIVTETDTAAEQAIVAVLEAERPRDGMVGEEGTNRPSQTGITWTIDPIDGTTNFVHDVCGFAVSIAAAIDGTTVIGVVHDIVRDERFAAAQGGGATRNGNSIEVSTKADLRLALVATGFSYDAARRGRQAQVLVTVLPEIADIRRQGSAAIDVCSVACGRVDAYYERGVSPWDIAAGAIIAREAGAAVTDHVASGGIFVASNPAISVDLNALLASSKAAQV